MSVQPCGEKDHRAEASRRRDGGSPTVVLVRQAKSGDRDALGELLDRYYKGWLRKYHGNLGTTVRRLYDTQDLVQSAIVDAMADLPHLDNEPAFFTWVTSIIRHKHAKRYRQLKRELTFEVGAEGSSQDLSEPEDERSDRKVQAADRYLHTLEIVLSLFPFYPEAMAVCVLRHLDGCSVADISARFGRPRSTVYRWLREGTDLLKARMRQ